MYLDPILEEIKNLIQNNNSDFKSFYYGDPLIIARSLLPSCIISKATTVVADQNMAEDEHRLNLVITVVTDIRQDFNYGDGLVAGWGSLYDLIEGREENRELKTSSIIHILKNNANLAYDSQIDVDNPMRVDYGLTVGKRGERSISVESNVFFTVFFDQLR